MRQRFFGSVLCLSVLVGGFALGRVLDRAVDRARATTVPIASVEVDVDQLRAVDVPRRYRSLAEAQGAELVPLGMRAISVGVAEGPVLARMLHPGAVIDLLGTVRGEGGARSGTVLDGVRVLGVAVDGDDARVTVLVRPDQAEWIALAELQGALRVALRADDRHVELDPELRIRLNQGRECVPEETP